MAITIECRGKIKSESGGKEKLCRKRLKLGTKICSKCGFNLKRGGNHAYWIDWLEKGERKRERIGHSKLAAELRLAEIKRAITEDRYIDRDLGSRMTLEELINWYLKLPEVLAKKSFKRDVQLLTSVQRLIGGQILIKDLNIGIMENYATRRLKEDSPTKKEEKISPATVNKERMQLNTALNRAVNHGKLDQNPLSGKMKKLNEDNVRERVLSEDEFETLLENLKTPLKEITLVAYHVAMRQKEILQLKWEQVDLDKKIIRLKGEDTKSGFKRKIPIHPRVFEMLQGLYECRVSNHVFLSNGKPIKVFSGNLKRLWDLAVKKSELGDFTFHDLRHCAINNLRLAGNDHFTIMAISGHKTTSVFKRYNVVTEEELRSVRWR